MTQPPWASASLPAKWVSQLLMRSLPSNSIPDLPASPLSSVSTWFTPLPCLDHQYSLLCPAPPTPPPWCSLPDFCVSDWKKQRKTGYFVQRAEKQHWRAEQDQQHEANVSQEPVNILTPSVCFFLPCRVSSKQKKNKVYFAIQQKLTQPRHSTSIK